MTFTTLRPANPALYGSAVSLGDDRPAKCPSLSWRAAKQTVSGKDQAVPPPEWYLAECMHAARSWEP